jgi:hypothetical protein
MSVSILTFGDVFTFCDETLIFLTDSISTKTVYAVKILDQEKSRQALMLRDKYEYLSIKNEKYTAFTLVVLSTKEFQDCVVRIDQPARDASLVGRPPYKRLNEEDCKKIKEEILNGSYPPDLKEKLSLTT